MKALHKRCKVHGFFSFDKTKLGFNLVYLLVFKLHPELSIILRDLMMFLCKNKYDHM